jgi:hypothetical protein
MTTKKKVVKKVVKKKTTTKKTASKLPTIYLQIAAYRDPELLNTIKSALDNATHPDRLVFGITWQHSPYEEWDNLDPYITDERFRIMDIDYRDAKGPCWARYQLNKMWKGETYTLQIDSHHRFAAAWDVAYIEMLEGLRSKECPKPLLSSYLPSFEPGVEGENRLEAPWIMEFDRFAPEGPVHFLPHTIDNYKELDKPQPSRFISGHFIFADGKFCQEVEYDPNYYFHGEEINLSVRAYMAGYDLFAPHRTYMWHEYTRDGKRKHWDDNPDWEKLDKHSHKHNRELLGIDKVTKKSLKKDVRTLKQYEMYAGLEFKTRRVHKDTIDKKVPPVSNNDIAHQSGLTFLQRVCIDVYKGSLPENDYTFWALALEDKDGNEIFRQDVNNQEVKTLLSVPYEKDKFAHIWRNFHSDVRPKKWVVWPHSESKGWCERLTGIIGAYEIED